MGQRAREGCAVRDPDFPRFQVGRTVFAGRGIQCIFRLAKCGDLGVLFSRTGVEIFDAEQLYQRLQVIDFKVR